MIKILSSPLTTHPNISPNSPPFHNSIFASRTLQDGLITGRRITNTTLELNSKDSYENINKFPIVIESIKNKRTPKEKVLVPISEDIAKIHNIHKSIQIRPKKRNLTSQTNIKETKNTLNILKEKNNNFINEIKSAEKKEPLKLAKNSTGKAFLLSEEEKQPSTQKSLKATKENLKKTMKKSKKLKKNEQKDVVHYEVKEKVKECKDLVDTIPLKKKKKKKKNTKTKKIKILPSNKVLKNEIPQSQVFESPKTISISKILVKSLEEFKAKKIQSLSNKKQKNLLSQEKIKTISNRNSEIRRSNLERFLKRQDMDPFSSKNFKPPWGLNQQRFKRYYLSRFLNEMNLNQEISPAYEAPKPEILTEQMRRTRLGLEFLQGMSEENIDYLIRKSKEKFLESEDRENSIAKKRIYSEEDMLEIRKFMDRKKEQIETENIQALLQDFLSQEKKKQNLQLLSEEIKEIFTSKQSKSIKMKSTQKPYTSPEELYDEQPLNEEFSLLYQEYKNFIAEKIPSKDLKKIASKTSSPPRNNKTNENIRSSNKKATSTNNNVVERYEVIKDKFDYLAKRFEKYIETKVIGDEEKEHELPISPLRKNVENFLENIEEEKDHLKSSDIESNRNNKLTNNELPQESSNLEKTRENSQGIIQANNINKLPISQKKQVQNKNQVELEESENDIADYDRKDYNKLENNKIDNNKIDKNKIYNNEGEYNEGEYNEGEYNEGEYNEGEYNEGEYNEGEYNEGEYNEGEYNEGEYNKTEHIEVEADNEGLNKQENKSLHSLVEEDQEDMDSAVWGENLQILENIAIMIQKVWRGYRTRKILDEYFEIILNGDYLENPAEEERHIPGNEIIMEDELEDQMESMHKENQMKKKKSRSVDYPDFGYDKPNDDYELYNKPANKQMSHNALYKPDSKNSDEYEHDKIMHISDIMEDEQIVLSKSLEKTKPQQKDPKNTNIFYEDILFAKNFSPDNIKMPPADIINSTDDFRKKLKEELDSQGIPSPFYSPNLPILNSEKIFEETSRKKDINEEIKEDSLEFSDTAQRNKPKKPRYFDSGNLSDSIGFSYKRKNKLLLNVDDIEKEHQIHEKFISDLSNKNSESNNLGEIRKTLCSEKLMKEQAIRSLSQSQSLNTSSQLKPLKIKPNSESLEDPTLKDSRDSKSKESKDIENLSIFEHDPFKEFTFKLYQDLKHNEVKKSSDLKESNHELSKGSFVEKKEKETPKSGTTSKRGGLEKWVNQEESQLSKKKESPLLDSKWNSPFYGFKKTQRDLFLLQRAGDPRNSYYNSYYSDEDGKNYGNEYDPTALLSKSWNGFHPQKKNSLNIMNQINDNPLSSSSKNIKIIEKFEVKDEKKAGDMDFFLDKQNLDKGMMLKIEDIEQKNGDNSSKNSSFKQYKEDFIQNPPRSDLFGEASSISKSRKNEVDSNRMVTEEDGGLDDEVNFKRDEESSINSNQNDNLIAVNKINKSLPPPQINEEILPQQYLNPQLLEILPLDKSLDNNALINNELVIKDEKSYKRDLNVSTVSNILVEELMMEFYGEMMNSPNVYGRFMDFITLNQLPSYKPINTSIFAVDEYLNILNNFIRERFSQEFLQNINQPYDKDSIGKLKLYNEAKQENSVKEFQIKPIDILPTQLYLELEELLINEEAEENKDQFSQELDHIHKKLLFDCFNESLEYFRPFDIRGKPNPWKLNQKKLTYSDIDQENMNIVLDQAKNKVMEWSMFQCGMLAEGTEFMMNYDMLNQLKQERLEKMIINEIYEKEEKWISYDDWESVVEIEISDLVLEGLLYEAIKEFGTIRNNNISENLS